MNKFNKFYNWIFDKWLAGFITATFFFLLKLYIELPAEKKGNFLNFKWVIYVLDTKYEVWKIIILAFVLLILYFIKKTYFNSSKKIKFEKIPNKIKAYTQDIFGIRNSKWTWAYGWDKYGKYKACKLQALCPTCNTPMIPYLNINKASCSKCRLEQKADTFQTEDPFDIENEISRRINTLLEK